ncbi:hypothetical protein SRHO_G00056340 [Serrasalmus rhombeus]
MTLSARLVHGAGRDELSIKGVRLPDEGGSNPIGAQIGVAVNRGSMAVRTEKTEPEGTEGGAFEWSGRGHVAEGWSRQMAQEEQQKVR